MLNYRGSVQAGICDKSDLTYPSLPQKVWKWKSEIVPGDQWPCITNRVCEAIPFLVVYSTLHFTCS